MTAPVFSSQENKAAFRTAIAAVLATFIAFELHLESPYWAGMSAVIVSSLYSGSIIDKAIMRFMGTLFGAIIGVWLASTLVNDFYSYIFSCFLIVAASTWYFHTSHYAYAWPLLSMAALMVLSQLAFTPDNTLNTAIWRSVEIGLGVFMAAFAALFIFPISLREAMAHQQQLMFSELLECFSILQIQIEKNADEHLPLRKAVNALKARCHQSSELIELMRSEPGLTQREIEHYRASIDTFFRCSRLLLSFEFEEHGPIEPSYANYLVPFKEYLQQLKQKHLGQPISAVSLEENLGSRQEGNKTFFYLLSRMKSCLVKIDELMEGQTPGDLELSEELPPTKLYPQLELFRRSVKSGLAVILALIFWLLNPSSGGLSGITSSVSISIRKSLYDMKQIAWHRLLGCLLGGGVALLVLLFVELNTRLLMVVLFGFIYFFSYLAYRYSYYMYLGQQACLALVISLAQGGGPALSLTPALNRLSGILIAIFAGFFIVNIAWRTDNVHFLKTELKRLHGYILESFQQLLDDPSSKKMSCNLTELFWMCRKTLNELVQETIRPSRERVLQKLERQLEDEALFQAAVCQLYDEVDLSSVFEFAEQEGLAVKALFKKTAEMLEQGGSQAEFAAQMERLKQFRDRCETFSAHPVALDYTVCCDLLELMMNIARRQKQEQDSASPQFSRLSRSR